MPSARPGHWYCEYRWRTLHPSNGEESAVGNATTKNARLIIRCDHRARRLLDKAASYAHLSVSEFVLFHALASAEQVVRAHGPFTLTLKDFQAFLKAVDAPAKPSAALKRAFRRHAENIRQ